MTRIIFFGGSTGYGAWDEEGGWVDRLKRHIHKKVVAGELYCFLYNLGISGKSTNDMIMRMDFEIKQRIKSNEETVVLVEAGTNDSRYVHSKGSRETSPDEFAKNLKKIIEISRKYADKIFFIGPREIDQTKTDPIPWRTDLSFRLKDI
ncbi:MAG: GDSL-type esterase/lipase family protein, partial [Candidatus Aenigmatarchaeota archaeon]